MTNEEAKEILFEQLQSFLPDYMFYGRIAEAYKMAIKAIEALNKLDFIIVEQLDNSTDFKECMTLRWVLDKMSEVIE